MIHGSATRHRTHAPHAEALAGPGPAVAGHVPSTISATDDQARGASSEGDTLSVLRLVIAVALIFAFGALAPLFAAAAR